jgi:uncharacterized protein YeeX (DUF496 family)
MQEHKKLLKELVDELIREYTHEELVAIVNFLRDEYSSRVD